MDNPSIPFHKYTGCGNDFILIDNRKKTIPLFDEKTRSLLCDRHRGIGADGIIFLLPSAIADYKMQYFNADGKEAALCGNGVRCLGTFLQTIDSLSETFSLETDDRIIGIQTSSDGLIVDFGRVTQMEWSIPLIIENNSFSVHTFSVGVPHLVLFVEDVTQFPPLLFWSSNPQPPPFSP